MSIITVGIDLAKNIFAPLAAVIGQFKADFITQFRHRLSFDQLRALSAIRQCRPAR